MQKRSFSDKRKWYFEYLYRLTLKGLRTTGLRSPHKQTFGNVASIYNFLFCSSE